MINLRKLDAIIAEKFYGCNPVKDYRENYFCLCTQEHTEFTIWDEGGTDEEGNNEIPRFSTNPTDSSHLRRELANIYSRVELSIVNEKWRISYVCQLEINSGLYSEEYVGVAEAETEELAVVLAALNSKNIDPDNL